MDAIELLIWARGPGLAWAIAILLFGIALRLVEILALGRKPDLSVPREASPGSGLSTIVSRSLPPPGMVKRAPVAYFGGYLFHLALFVTVFFSVPHIELVRGLTGLGWPGLPSAVVDAVAVIGILAMFAVLASRLTDPVKKMLSGFGDYFAWALTFAPLATGYLAHHHLLLEYTMMLALHILSVELLLAALPFTKLFHAVSLFLSRWYNGEWFGRRGVAS